MLTVIVTMLIIVTMIIMLMMISKNNETSTNTTIEKVKDKNTNGDNDNCDKTKKRTVRRITVKSCRFYKCYLLAWNPAWAWTSITDTPYCPFMN